jgi:hypothetical protein
MSKTRAEKIDELLMKLEELTDEKDSLMVFMKDGIENNCLGMLLSNSKGDFVRSFCECMESGEQIGSDLMDLFSSTIISFAKAHPRFATVFIQTFNKAIYGLERYDTEESN